MVSVPSERAAGGLLNRRRGRGRAWAGTSGSHLVRLQAGVTVRDPGANSALQQ